MNINDTVLSWISAFLFWNLFLDYIFWILEFVRLRTNIWSDVSWTISRCIKVFWTFCAGSKSARIYFSFWYFAHAPYRLALFFARVGLTTWPWDVTRDSCAHSIWITTCARAHTGPRTCAVGLRAILQRSRLGRLLAKRRFEVIYIVS